MNRKQKIGQKLKISKLKFWKLLTNQWTGNCICLAQWQMLLFEYRDFMNIQDYLIYKLDRKRVLSYDINIL